ncbi:hypothetical protein [Roseococcus sp. YIM B11640]|uniref:hypothetical protein n=1 Tax=Roseococcus sp. YIM B11640 TaxID=3133973 RepID=UPI003C7BAC14
MLTLVAACGQTSGVRRQARNMSGQSERDSYARAIESAMQQYEARKAPPLR